MPKTKAPESYVVAARVYGDVYQKLVNRAVQRGVSLSTIAGEALLAYMAKDDPTVQAAPRPKGRQIRVTVRPSGRSGETMADAAARTLAGIEQAKQEALQIKKQRQAEAKRIRRNTLPDYDPKS